MSYKKKFQMITKTKLFILIPAIILVSLLLAMTPFSIAQNLSKRGPVIYSRQTCLGNSLFNSLVPQDGPTVAVLNSTRLEQEPMPVEAFIALIIYSPYHNISQDSVPLRC
jgi:hypothetical protein